MNRRDEAQKLNKKLFKINLLLIIIIGFNNVLLSIQKFREGNLTELSLITTPFFLILYFYLINLKKVWFYWILLIINILAIILSFDSSLNYIFTYDLFINFITIGLIVYALVILKGKKNFKMSFF